MSVRATIAAVAVTGVLGAASAPAHAGTVCTWGGTPAAPTGQNRNTPGITDTPSTAPISFHATGPLGGGCRGRLTFDGQMDTGTTCGLITFHGVARGLPGVVRFAGTSVAGVAPARLYDRAGNVVGSENAQFLTNAPFTECLTPQGLERNNFSSVIVLF